MKKPKKPRRVVPIRLWVNSHGEAWGDIGEAMVRIKQVAGPSIKSEWGQEIELVGSLTVKQVVKSS